MQNCVTPKQTLLEKKRQRNRKYYLTHREQIINKTTAYHKNHPEQTALSLIRHRRKNKEALNAKRREAYARLTQEEKNARNAKKQWRYANNLNFRVTCILRGRFNQALRDRLAHKWDTTFNLLGCSLEFFIQHIESKWLFDMSWANYGKEGWHIDHVKPCAAFDLDDPLEQAKCFHWTNMQPLWARDNLSKSAAFCA